jgi:hypothetical protein
MDALVTMFTAALPATVTVSDGPLVGESIPDSYVTVGYGPLFDGDFTGAAVEGAQEVLQLGNRVRGEEFAITCMASVWTGDSDAASVSRTRLAVRALFNSCAAALVADSTVAGTVDPPGYASVSTVAWLVDQADTGCAVSIVFTVMVNSQWLPA